MKILYVSQYFPPEMGAPAGRAAELARHWQQAGHQVTVLTGFPNHPTGVLAPEYRSHFHRLVMQEQVSGVRVVRTWLLPLPNRKAHERMLNYSSFCVSSALTGLGLCRPDLVIASSPQLLVGLSGWWLARWKRVPFILEVRDLWPESLAAVGMGNHDSMLYRVLARIAGFLYENSHHVVVVTPAFKGYLTQHWHVPSEKISIVENGVETNLFSPHAVDPELRRCLGAEGKFLVSYVGTMGLAQGLATVVDSAETLQTTSPQVLFLMVGEGAEKERIRGLAKARGLKNMVFLDQQPREKIPALICASDVCLVLLKKGDVFQTVIPTKMLEFMSCARPLILGVAGQAQRILEQANAGIVIEPENSTELSRAILGFAAGADVREALGRNGRRHIIEHFSRQRTAAAYAQILEGLVIGARWQQAAAASSPIYG